ncbi:type IV secretion system protein VirB2 [Hydrogenophaga palleronii]|uniref:Type IV secretion system protein VirB2 n=1 Tax=Hydrogenophaga palleronii TaxID=65655 RepID=A0ABU1WHY5_9BURK|nr:TrbC/VirB2 family protein [Hydrogenophaga palleronii]MDR7148878.1 type IV secretion system protein VirB2 [Hydrogenophaga palleronii]
MHPSANRNRIEWNVALMMIVGLCLVGFMPEALAQQAPPPGFTAACQNVDGFMQSVVRLLGAVSIGVVTVAIIFAGYQIAFAHKRLSDVAPILIGGLLIGGAATIATWFVGSSIATC